MQVQIEARTLQQNLGNNLETFNTNAEIELYERLAKAKASERLAEAQARKLSVASRREELKLIEAANQKNLQQVGLLNDSQKERLAGLLGTDDFTKITFNQVEKARETLAIEEESGVTPDKALKESVERLGALATNTARVNKIKSEEAQYNYETIKIIKALNIELANLKIERLQKILEVRELTRDLNKSLSGDNEQLFSAKQELRSNTAQLARSIFDQKEAYDQAIIGINDFTYSLTSSTKELARRLTQMGRDMYTAVVGSMSSYLGAAEIEDILGFGKIRELITKAAGITSSDRRPQIQAEIESETRNYSNSTRDQKKNQVRMNLDLDRAVFDLQGQQNELGRRRRFNPEDTEIDLERLKLRVLELPNTIAQKNRDIDGANQAAKEYGVTGYVPPIDVPLPDLSQFKTPQEVTAAINNIYAELQKANQETIDLYGRIKTEGNAAINRALADSRSAFENNMQSKHQLLEAEGDRVSQGYELLGRESEGLFFALNQGLEKQILGLKAKGLEARKAISDLFTNSGISLNRETIVNTIIETKTQEIDSQISSLTQVREQMKKYLEVENSDDLLKLLASDRNLNNIDPEFREELIGKIKAIASTDDFKSVLSLIEGQNGDYTQLIGILGSKKEELVNGTIELFNRKGDRRLQDIDLDFAQEQFNGKYNLTDIEKQKIQVEIDASKASIELSRQMEDLVGELPSEAIDEIRIKLERLNKIKFDRLRKEATLTFKMIQSAKDAMESAFSSIFTGFGDALFKGIGNEDEIEKLKINAEYAEKLREVQDKYADDPDQLGKASERLEMLNNVKLDKVKQEFNAFHNIVGVVKNAILEFSKAMVAALAQVAAKAVATFIITSALGGGKPSFSGLNKAPKGFSLGGEVENFALGGAISDGGIRRAMSREGTGAVVVVAHKGEQLLSARTGDAQLFRALERSGRWREIKQQHHVPNYSMGGSVGSSRASGSYSNNGGSSKGNVTINNNYDVRVQGENQMRKTSSQLIAEADARNKRIAARNG